MNTRTVAARVATSAALTSWIALIFAVGALFFAFASAASLFPALAARCSLDIGTINQFFFAGSIPFTTAAYLQLFQAANTRTTSVGTVVRARAFGWRPGDAVWISSALQFVGTVLFNFNTYDAMLPALPWYEEELLVWGPNLAGSVLFLASGCLAFINTGAFINTCQSRWAFRPREILWWSAAINLLGCLGFMASALLSIVLPGGSSDGVIEAATAFTLQGAFCFFVGALLMLPWSRWLQR